MTLARTADVCMILVRVFAIYPDFSSMMIVEFQSGVDLDTQVS